MEDVRHGVDPQIEERIRSAIPSALICGKIILSQRNLIPESDNLTESPRLLRDEGGPAFAKPWSVSNPGPNYPNLLFWHSSWEEFTEDERRTALDAMQVFVELQLEEALIELKLHTH
jgi:hypothetical protein